MNKKANKIAIVIITILMGELINAYSLSFLVSYKSELHPYRSVAITMMCAVCIYYPAFILINKYLKGFSSKYMNKSSRYLGGQFSGKIAGFALAVFLIFMANIQILYHRNVVADVFSWISQLF